MASKMSLDGQTKLYDQVLIQLEGLNIAGRMPDIALRADHPVRFDLYTSTVA